MQYTFAGRTTPGLGSPSRPVVIGHRGAPGYRPEHTLESHELAARLGAEWLEPDVVSTRDGVLVIRHEPEISATTDVASRPEFAGRRTTKTIGGEEITGWFAEDFTLAELRTLAAVERLPELRRENCWFDGLFTIATLQELLDLRHRLSAELGREIGVYIEIKHSTYFRDLGLPIEPLLLRMLRRNGLDHPEAPVIVESFEVSNLIWLRNAGLSVPIVQLIEDAGAPEDFAATGDPRTYDDMVTVPGLRDIARYAQGIAPRKSHVISVGADGYLDAPTGLVDRAHAEGLVVHPFTFRAENMFLPKDFARGDDPASRGDAMAEQQAFLAAGIDGLFSDQPDLTVLVRAFSGRAGWSFEPAPALSRT